MPVRFRPSVPSFNIFVLNHWRFKLFFRILGYLKPHGLLLFGSIVLTFLYALANIYAMPLIRDMTDQLANKNLVYFSNHVANAVLLYSIYLGTKYGQVYLMSYVSYKVFIELRLDLYQKLQRLSLDFYTEWKVGEIISRVFSDAEMVRNAILKIFERLLPCILSLIAVSGYLIYLNWKLAAFTLLAMPFFISIIMYFSRIIKKVAGQIQQKLADITHILQENVSNIQVVQAFTMEDREMKRFKKQHRRNLDAFMKEVRLKVTEEPLISFLQFVVILLIIWFGGYEVINGRLKGSELLAFFTGIFILVEQVQKLTASYTLVYQSMASVERIYEILDHKESIQDPEKPIKLQSVKGHVSFENMSFSYDEKLETVLKNINLDIKPGETIALVGLSGAGKSTFVNLIPRFYDPTEGGIKLDGVNLKDLKTKELRSYISIVPQEVVMFSGTILENIRYGSPDTSVDLVIDAIKQANAYEFIKDLPEGLLTKVGDKGVKLSGGQRQRISIARALLRNPKVLILDEATSSLDSESEHLVQEALEKLMKNRTTVVVAHRLSTIMTADHIIVLEKGQIIEKGTHQDLLSKEGAYAKLYQLQVLGS
ncbi:ABC transporter ATP-binding protein [Candidatus Marinamargulisbacteria bacterium SCGC AG-439-L15]|nr:ABC transporter ATP-binding protein [Candidatus Marinamargulisbacteria bacterium SCGC AG-439-L15]